MHIWQRYTHSYATFHFSSFFSTNSLTACLIAPCLNFLTQSTITCEQKWLVGNNGVWKSNLWSNYKVCLVYIFRHHNYCPSCVGIFLHHDILDGLVGILYLSYYNMLDVFVHAFEFLLTCNSTKFNTNSVFLNWHMLSGCLTFCKRLTDHGILGYVLLEHAILQQSTSNITNPVAP